MADATHQPRSLYWAQGDVDLEYIDEARLAPGAGKTLLARALPSILPRLALSEALDITRIYSVAGALPDGEPLVRTRPFRSPHHTISHAAYGAEIRSRPPCSRETCNFDGSVLRGMLLSLDTTTVFKKRSICSSGLCQ